MVADADQPRRLHLDADVERLAELRAFIRRSAAELGASEGAVLDLVQAVDEASCNIVIHGYRGGPGPLDIDVERRGRAIAVRLRDRALAFDPTAATPAAPRVTASTNHHPKSKGAGVGVRLLRTLMDEVHHSARPDGGNELTLVRSLDGQRRTDRCR